MTFYLCADALYLGILAASLTISFFPKGITRKVQCQYAGHSTGFVSIIKSNREGVLLIFFSLMNLIQQDLSPHSAIPFFFIGFVRLDDSFWLLLKAGRYFCKIFFLELTWFEVIYPGILWLTDRAKRMRKRDLARINLERSIREKQWAQQYQAKNHACWVVLSTTTNVKMKKSSKAHFCLPYHSLKAHGLL